MVRNRARRLEQFPQDRNVVVRVDIVTEETEETQHFIAIDAVWTVVRESKEESQEHYGQGHSLTVDRRQEHCDEAHVFRKEEIVSISGKVIERREDTEQGEDVQRFDGELGCPPASQVLGWRREEWPTRRKTPMGVSREKRWTC